MEHNTSAIKPDVDIGWREFRQMFPKRDLDLAELDELFTDGFVAVGVNDGTRRVFTIRLEVALSDIPELTEEDGRT